MRRLIITAGEYQFFDEPAQTGGLIGGKVIALKPETGEEFSRMYKKFHTGKTDKFNVLAQLIRDIIPPEEINEKEVSEENE